MSDRRTANFDADILQLIFQRVQEKALRRNEEEKHAADRHQRRAVDALRSRIKRLDPPVRPGDTWEQVQPRVERLEEYKAIESDELRQSAFEKVIRRLKEKEEDEHISATCGWAGHRAGDRRNDLRLMREPHRAQAQQARRRPGLGQLRHREGLRHLPRHGHDRRPRRGRRSRRLLRDSADRARDRRG